MVRGQAGFALVECILDQDPGRLLPRAVGDFAAERKMSFIVDGITTAADGRIEARRIGEFMTHDEAVTAAKQVIDAFLFREYRQGAGHGITAKKLLAQFRRSGEVPLILRKSEASTVVSSFDHLEYAARRCAELCRGEKHK